MVVALKEVKIRGEIRTTIDYCVEMIQSPDFVGNAIHTGWLDSRIASHVSPDSLLSQRSDVRQTGHGRLPRLTAGSAAGMHAKAGVRNGWHCACMQLMHFWCDRGRTEVVGVWGPALDAQNILVPSLPGACVLGVVGAR